MSPLVLALAQESDAAAIPGVGDAVRGIVAVAVVLLLIGAVAWLLRRSPLALRGSARGPVRIETAVPLGERRSLVIVDVEGRRLLLGLTPTQVALVAELGRADAAFGQALDRSVTNPETANGKR